MSDGPPPVHAGRSAGGNGPLTAAEVDAVLADFRAWLEAGGEPDVGPVDLLTSAREFTALRHDVQLQTKATRAAVEKLSESPDIREIQRPLVEALIEVAEALRIGLRQTRDAEIVLAWHMPDEPDPPKQADYPRPTWWEKLRGWRQSSAFLAAEADWQREHYRRRRADDVNPVVSGVSNGYALSLRRADRALAAAGVEPFGEVGDRFDPDTMEAVKVKVWAGRPAGEVASVGRRGYRWHGGVFQFAQVTVSASGPAEPDTELGTSGSAGPTELT